MADSSLLQRWLARLSDLPQLALPTDYPRPSGENALSMVEAREVRQLDNRTGASLLRLSLYDEHEGESDDESDADDADSHLNRKGIDAALAQAAAGGGAKTRRDRQRPTAFHILLAAFAVLLHRYTGDTDLVIATSSPSSPEPLLLRIKLDPADSFWSLVKRVQFLENEAEEDKIPYETLLDALPGYGKEAQREGGPAPPPVFRVRFFDQTDSPDSSFVQQTSLTSDLTVFVSTTPTDEPSAAQTPGSTSGTATPTTPSSLRTSLTFTPPRISLTLSYNSLVFSQPRISLTIDQLLHVLHHVSAHPQDAIGSFSLLTSKQRRILPDPKADLEWCGYRGAITDIFSNNARQFPDRVCIVESIASDEVGGKNGERRFTYRQIDEASNVLAHHLVQSGVQREEVVTVYSTRGVDLVVAVMGVLKAGATFSVIGAFGRSLIERLRLLTPSSRRSRLPSRQTDDLPPSRPTPRTRHPRRSRQTPPSRAAIRLGETLDPSRSPRSPTYFHRPRAWVCRLTRGGGEGRLRPCPGAQERAAGHPARTGQRGHAEFHEWVDGDPQGRAREALLLDALFPLDEGEVWVERGEQVHDVEWDCARSDSA